MKVRFSHLSSSERRKIERWRQMKLSPDEMARRLGRHRSTIFRELRRNHFPDGEIPKLSGYCCVVAQSYSDGRRTRQRKLVRDPGLCDQVERCLRSGWTPEQIAGRMRYEGAPRRVCQETIYQHIYSDGGRRGELWRRLPSGRRRRRGYRLRKRPPPRFAPELSILFRPDVIAHRKQFGHWEADLVLFRQKYGPANVTNMIERTSRFLVALKNTEKRIKPIMAQIAQALTPLPRRACQSITIDHGSKIHRLVASTGRDRYADLVLRGAVTLVERCRRERQQASQTLALPRHRSEHSLPRGAPSALRRPQRHAA